MKYRARKICCLFFKIWHSVARETFSVKTHPLKDIKGPSYPCTTIKPVSPNRCICIAQLIWLNLGSTWWSIRYFFSVKLLFLSGCERLELKMNINAFWTKSTCGKYWDHPNLCFLNVLLDQWCNTDWFKKIKFSEMNFIIRLLKIFWTEMHL